MWSKIENKREGGSAWRIAEIDKAKPNEGEKKKKKSAPGRKRAKEARL